MFRHFAQRCGTSSASTAARRAIHVVENPPSPPTSVRPRAEFLPRHAVGTPRSVWHTPGMSTPAYGCQSVRTRILVVKSPAGKYTSITLLQHGPSSTASPSISSPTASQVVASRSCASHRSLAPPPGVARASMCIRPPETQGWDSSRLRLTRFRSTNLKSRGHPGS